MTQSVPSRMAFATSVDSARVGRLFSVIDSSIWVAVITGFPNILALSHELLLDNGDLFNWYFNTEVPTGNHYAIGNFQNIINIV